MRVLVLAYLFPPAGGGGVQRTVGFVRYLPEFGITPVVVSGSGNDYWARDPSLLDGLAVDVHRVHPGPGERVRLAGRRLLPRLPRRLFDQAFVPDARVLWAKAALERALTLHTAGAFGAVYASGPPWSGLSVGARFSRQTGVPLLADFRDPWSDNPLVPPPRWTRRWHRQLEAEVHARAKVSIASTEGYRRRMVASFGLPAQATDHIPNGFTETDFQPALPTTDDGPLTLGYAGSFYGVHRPDALLDALARVARDGGPRARIELFGQTGDLPPSSLEIRSHGYVPQRSALEGLSRCHGVFVTVPDVPGAAGCVPQKLYVYLRLGRPVLWCGPEGDAAEILRRAGGCHFILDPGRPDIEGLALWLRETAIRRGNAGFRREVVERYDRRHLTAQLADHLVSVGSARARVRR